MRRSIHGTLTNAKRQVIESGPTAVQAQRGAAATPKSHTPHQNVTSPR
jgi:hypothetical protein